MEKEYIVTVRVKPTKKGEVDNLLNANIVKHFVHEMLQRHYENGFISEEFTWDVKDKKKGLKLWL